MSDNILKDQIDSGGTSSSIPSSEKDQIVPQPILDVSEQNVVDFEGPSDPENPLNWSWKRKWTMVALVSFENLMVNLATIICAPATPQILRDFHSTNALDGTIIVSIWELGEILGPMLLAPLSELYGRLYIYNIANILFTIFSIASALSTSINMLIGFRFLSGLAVASTSLNAGTVVDMFPQSERGTAMSMIGFSPLVGVICGPILGGYVTANLSWRWAFWLVAIVAGCLEVGFLLFFRESYAITILKRKAQRLRQETGNLSLRSKFDRGKTARDMFGTAIIRPVKLLTFSPIVMMLTLYNSVIYGYLYLVITTMTSVFESVYHFKQGPIGLTYLGIGIGMTLGVIICKVTLDRLIKRQAAKIAQTHDGNDSNINQPALIDPEHRLSPILLGGTILPIGLFLYGWTAQYHKHWIAPIIGTGLLGFGLMVTTIPTSTYLMDVYTIYAASAAAANLCLKNLFGTVLPLAGPPLYKKLGLGWGNSTLGFVALAFVPIPLLLMKFGKRMRSSESRRLVL